MPRHSFAFSSSATAGAQQVSADGSEFSVVLAPPLEIPSTASNLELAVVSAAIWNTSPNILTGENDEFTYTSTAAPAGTATITIPQGLYSLEALNGYLSLGFVAAGRSSTLFSLSGATATGQVAITAENAGDSIDFTAAASVAPLLGWAAGIYTFTAGETIFGAGPAAFNRNNTYLITSDICQGLRYNSRARNIIGVVPINQPPGSLLNYDPSNLIRVPADDMRGVTVSNARFALKNQDFQATPTANELYSFTCELTYTT
jgi:hypothetical protein